MTDPLIAAPAVAPAAPVLPALEEQLASAVAGCRDVVGLSEGPFGEAATHLPGRRVDGIRVQPDVVTVNVVARLGVPLPLLAERVRSACTPFADGRQVDVVIDDVIAESDDGAQAAAGPQGAATGSLQQ